MPPVGSSAPTGPVLQHLGPLWRAAYVLLGVVALAVAALLLLSFEFATFALWLFVVVALFALGLFDILSSQNAREASAAVRTWRLVLGVLILGFAFLALFDLLYAFLLLTILVGVGLLFQGLYLLVGVGRSGHLTDWQRNLGTALGAIDIVLAFLVLAFPILAFVLVWVLIALAVIVAAIHFLATGLSGVRRPILPEEERLLGATGVLSFARPPSPPT